jgi:drug/metabolite transporter (DMT)-like permease
VRTTVFTAAALVAFASNSLLCRMALGQRLVDATSFSVIRLVTGAVTLVLIGMIASRGRPLRGSWPAAIALFVYAFPFSFAYTLLTTGTGALILFGSVQVTMMLTALADGERPPLLHWLGLFTAVAGLVYLVLPGLAAPPLAGAALMAVAGVAWGVYTLMGRRSGDPLAQNAGNFVRALPLAAIVLVVGIVPRHADPSGVALAVASGAISTGLGYVVWYAALRGMTTTRASLVQLPVPIIAAAGGVLVMGESFTMRLAVSAAAVLGGIALTIVGSQRPRRL